MGKKWHGQCDNASEMAMSSLALLLLGANEMV
jgi:hypothetical protein